MRIYSTSIFHVHECVDLIVFAVCRIITSNSQSTYPAATKQDTPETLAVNREPHSFGRDTYAEGLRPWLLTYSGTPRASLAAFHAEYLPSVAVIRINEDNAPKLGSYERQRPVKRAHRLVRDCLTGFLDPDSLKGRLFPDGTHARCEVRYNRESQQEPWVLSTLRAVTAQDVILQSRIATGYEHDDEQVITAWEQNGEEDVVTGPIPVSPIVPNQLPIQKRLHYPARSQRREIAVINEIPCKSIAYDICVQLSPSGAHCHMGRQGIAGLCNPLLEIARNTVGLSDVLMRSAWDVSYRFFAVIEGEDWSDRDTAVPLCDFRKTSTSEAVVMPESFIACTDAHQCDRCQEEQEGRDAR